jgi:hypothetical protein
VCAQTAESVLAFASENFPNNKQRDARPFTERASRALQISDTIERTSERAL